MSLLNIYKDTYADSTVISNRFIDDYMKDANEAEIKVYLYLVRMMSANLPTSISDIADRFNHTEREVMRALKYWEKCNLLSLEFNESRLLTGVCFLTPSEERPFINTERSQGQIVPLKIVSDSSIGSMAGGSTAKISASKDSLEDTPAYSYDKLPAYSRNRLNEFKNDPSTAQILLVAEAYLGKLLTPSDMQSLLFFHDELHFSCEFIDYLLQYCIDQGSKDFRYITKVAISWKEQGIESVADLKAKGPNRYKKYVYSILKSLGKNSAPVKAEADYAIRWHEEYGLPLDVIDEACNRTVKATDSHRLEYCDKILTAWNNAGVKSLSDIATCDSSFTGRKSSMRQAVGSNSFNSFERTDYNFDELEKTFVQ